MNHYAFIPYKDRLCEIGIHVDNKSLRLFYNRWMTSRRKGLLRPEWQDNFVQFMADTKGEIRGYVRPKTPRKQLEDLGFSLEDRIYRKLYNTWSDLRRVNKLCPEWEGSFVQFIVEMYDPIKYSQGETTLTQVDKSLPHSQVNSYWENSKLAVKANIALTASLKEDGLTCYEIADTLKVSKASVYKRLTSKH